MHLFGQETTSSRTFVTQDLVAAAGNPSTSNLNQYSDLLYPFQSDNGA